MATPKILVFAGSIRSGSLNARLASAAVKELAISDVSVTHLSLADYPLPIYDGDLEAASGVPEKAEALRRVMTAHEGIFVASPEYNAGMAPLLKNALDWVSRIRTPPSPWRERAWLIGAASPGMFGGLRGLMQLRQTLVLGLGVTVLPEQVLVPRAADAFTEAGTLKDETLAKTLKTGLGRLVEEAGRYVR